jgi:hypothetical protein
MVLTLSEGSAYFQFVLAKLISLPTIVMDYLCLRTGEVYDSSLLESQLGNLSGEQRKDMQDLVLRHADILTSRLGLIQLLGNIFQLKDIRLVKLPPWGLVPPKIFFFCDHIKQLLAEGVTEESLSSYSIPVFLVPKGPNNFRAVVDYRLLN